MRNKKLCWRLTTVVVIPTRLIKIIPNENFPNEKYSMSRKSVTQNGLISETEVLVLKWFCTKNTAWNRKVSHKFTPCVRCRDRRKMKILGAKNTACHVKVWHNSIPAKSTVCHWKASQKTTLSVWCQNQLNLTKERSFCSMSLFPWKIQACSPNKLRFILGLHFLFFCCFKCGNTGAYQFFCNNTVYWTWSET